MLHKKVLFVTFVALLASSCSNKFPLAEKFAEKLSISTTSNANSATVSEEQNKAELGRQVVFFDTNSAKLSNEAISVIEKNVLSSISANKGSKVVIEGYCDERGSFAYNQKLGKQRSAAVKAYLVKKGIKSSKIKVVTYGKSNPVDSGHNEESWAKNRRAVIVSVAKQ